MSKNEAMEKQAKAVDAEVKPAEEDAKQDKAAKTRRIFGYEIRKAEKTPKLEKVKPTKEEKKAAKQEKWTNFKANAKAKAKKVAPVVLLVTGMGIGVMAKTFKDSQFDHPTEDKPEEEVPVRVVVPGEVNEGAPKEERELTELCNAIAESKSSEEEN